jgi:two-component system, cell cycle response regulator DivK
MRKVVLIAEDDPKSMKLTYDLLNVFGYTTLTAANGLQAVEMAKFHKPDLILMDVQMPVMDGLTATRLIKADSNLKDIPIIATTAYAMRDDENKTKEAGCDGYITKPIDIQYLLRTIEKYLSQTNTDQIILNRRCENEKQKS